MKRLKTFHILLLAGLFCLNSSVLAQEEGNDPIEDFNRATFWFNDQVDTYLLAPVAHGYDYITPKAVQNSVENFFENLRFPSFLISDLVQAKYDQVGIHTSRFLINSTLGVAGLFDIAKDFGLESHYEDFGTTLGYHGTPEGAYLVLPLLGPSNVRDALGRCVDFILDPLFHLQTLTNLNSDERLILSSSLIALDVVNTRAKMTEAINSAKESSLDYYGFVRAAYHQRRQNLIYDDAPPIEQDSELENNEQE